METQKRYVNSYIDEAVSTLLPAFEALAHLKTRARERGDGKLIGWRKLAISEAEYLKHTYPDPRTDEGEKTYSTCLRQVTALNKALKERAKDNVKDPANLTPVRTIIKRFSQALTDQFSIYRERRNAEYVARVHVRRVETNQVPIDVSEYLKKAHHILAVVAEENPDNATVKADYGFTWMDVSTAVSLATGRRMVEVHHTGNFIYLDTYQLGFTGQAKGKGRKVNEQMLKDVVFEIPTLIPAQLVKAGVDWLGANGKRCKPDEPTSRVNERYSKPLNENMKANWDFIPDGYTDGIDSKTGTPKPLETTYHKCRAAYFNCALANEKELRPIYAMDFMRSVLGDRDEQSLESYQRFNIEPDSVTRI